MSNNKIIQVMPLPESKSIISADRSGDRNVTKFIVGAALMDNGKVLPLVWDGKFTFRTFDPVVEVFAEWCERVFGPESPVITDRPHDPDREKRAEAFKRFGNPMENIGAVGSEQMDLADNEQREGADNE